MQDVHLILDNRPGELARFGQAMGDAGVSLEGGGVFTTDGKAHAHFLVEDGKRAEEAARAAGLEVVAVREVLVRRLKQDQPGQLGAIARALAEAGVNIITQYSDHANQLVLVVDDVAKAAVATADWAA
ncbi:MAG TPA: amino acid-binding protein [Sphingomicrobium sp.]|nr:amino acid-binding protein [Sphingomicrobium sp.]